MGLCLGLFHQLPFEDLIRLLEEGHQDSSNEPIEAQPQASSLDNDPVVISVVTAGRKVHRVLVDQGSSASVMFLVHVQQAAVVPRSVEAVYRVLIWLR